MDVHSLPTVNLALERKVEHLNNQSYSLIDSISKTNYFSKIKLNFYEKCPKLVESCSISSCSIRSNDKDGYTDLLSVIESYSPSVKKSNLIWEDIYKSMPNEAMKNIVSGLHFSVTTHITAFHTQILGTFISNPLKFQKTFHPIYKNNFLRLYLLVRASIGNLKNTPTEIPEGLNELIDSLHMTNYPTIEKSATKHIDVVTGHIACLNCEKCKFWGTLQAKGLKAMVKSLNNIKLYKEDIICLVNLFRRLSETVKQSRRLNDARFIHLRLMLVHYKEFLVLSLFVLLLMFCFLKVRQIRIRSKFKHEKYN